MCQGLIWLADRLRISYGEGGLLSLLIMLCRASQRLRTGLMVAGERQRDLDPTGLGLAWPSWFPASFADRQAQASSLATLIEAGVIDRQAAFAIVAPMYGLAGSQQPDEQPDT